VCVHQQPFQVPNSPNLQGCCSCSSDPDTKQKDTYDYQKVHSTPATPPLLPETNTSMKLFFMGLYQRVRK
jgi:hypothetical protein